MVYVVDPGDSKFRTGQLITKAKAREVNTDLKKKDKKPMEIRDAEPATFDNILLGITQAALSTESWISAASFQETTKVLTNAATAAKSDTLVGLKENVVMGHLIPAGTGLKKYKNILVIGDEPEIEVTEESDEKVKESKESV
jgi:DNA-directed RNA polymerase subunit beta'